MKVQSKDQRLLHPQLVPLWTFFVDSVYKAKVEHVVDNDVVELERPMDRKVEKAKWKAPSKPVEDILQISKINILFFKSHTFKSKSFSILRKKRCNRIEK